MSGGFVHRQGCWVLYSADFSIIAPEDDVFVFYLTESIFLHGDVIRDISEKGLHILDASVDVTLHALHLFLAH